MIIVSRELEIVYVNTAARRLTHPSRLRRGRSLPEPWSGFSLHDYAERLFVPGVGTDEMVRADEEHTFVVSGVTNRGQETAAILIEDVSAKERRRRAEREFVANAAHELLTPLTGIVSAAHVLQAGAKEVPEDRDRFITHIARECDRMAQTARALLVLARAQSGEQPPRLEVVRLRDLLDDIIATATAETTATANVSCNRELTVFVDSDLFVQALLNLVLNAAKHGPGPLFVTANPTGVGKVAIDIVDSSARSTVEELERFGMRFYSRDGRDSGGFGLGLSIARQSIEAIGGALILRAAAGEGLEARVEVLSGKVSEL